MLDWIGSIGILIRLLVINAMNHEDLMSLISSSKIAEVKIQVHKTLFSTGWFGSRLIHLATAMNCEDCHFKIPTSSELRSNYDDDVTVHYTRDQVTRDYL